jgi:hypothetical protein
MDSEATYRPCLPYLPSQSPYSRCSSPRSVRSVLHQTIRPRHKRRESLTLYHLMDRETRLEHVHEMKMKPLGRGIPELQ